MKKIIQLICLALVIAMVTPISAKNISLKTNPQLKKKTSMVDFMVYNSTSSTGWVYVYNTVTDETTYFSIPANTPSNGTAVGQIPANNDIYSGQVHLIESDPRTIQFYFNYETNVTDVYGADMALGCGACAFVRIN